MVFVQASTGHVRPMPSVPAPSSILPQCVGLIPFLLDWVCAGIPNWLTLNPYPFGMTRHLRTEATFVRSGWGSHLESWPALVSLSFIVF